MRLPGRLGCEDKKGHQEMGGSELLLLCDGDGNLFPSEGPAFLAATAVANAMLESVGSPRRYDPEELRLATLGRNFRDTARLLLEADGRQLDQAALEAWVEREKAAATSRLAEELRPDPAVRAALAQLRGRFRLAVVTSSAASRLDASLLASELDDLFSPEVRFSAEDSLPEPRSKPDPAVYRFALEKLGVRPDRALAVEDSPPGVRSALGAGLTVVGNVVYALAAERDERREDLAALGASAVVDSWEELTELAMKWADRHQ